MNALIKSTTCLCAHGNHEGDQVMMIFSRPAISLYCSVLPIHFPFDLVTKIWNQFWNDSSTKCSSTRRLCYRNEFINKCQPFRIVDPGKPADAVRRPSQFSNDCCLSDVHTVYWVLLRVLLRNNSRRESHDGCNPNPCESVAEPECA